MWIGAPLVHPARYCTLCSERAGGSREERSVAHTRPGCSGPILSADLRVSSRQLIPQMTLPCERSPCCRSCDTHCASCRPPCTQLRFPLFALTFQMSFGHPCFAFPRLHAAFRAVSSECRETSTAQCNWVLKWQRLSNQPATFYSWSICGKYLNYILSLLVIFFII